MKKIEIEKILLCIVTATIFFLIGYNVSRSNASESKSSIDLKSDTMAFNFDNICRIDSFDEDEDPFYLIVYEDSTRFFGNIDIYASKEQMRHMDEILTSVENIEDEYMYNDVMKDINDIVFIYNDSIKIFELYITQ